ncbi:DUF4251 domain-containing protein [Chitinophagaceae bacterium LB-8]|uniref:DUF4251 domain-containing protein n=1 Tax=Paraflavisolibacter caeni TaxID=2982496 RepID=A0A9X3B8X5_9BACT|nr:DUF4251 domain-containing protein [Paraflavisolibacter caeni]MCU7550326.1 DUF4251 domain-containing protein [Paraflavisolibacter caeni]
MKILKNFLQTTLLLVIGTATCLHIASAQETEKETKIKNLIGSGNYVFEAQSALPSRGQVRQLTYGYEIRVSKDTLISYLPYFGRAYVAPVDPSEGGYNFTSTDFEYNVKEGKKGGWDVSIQTKDQRDNKKMALKIQESGYASLQVTSNDRQPISYNGIITAVKKK